MVLIFVLRADSTLRPSSSLVNDWPVLPMRQTGPEGGIAAKVALSFCLRVCTRISHGVPRADTGQCFPRDPEDVFKWDRASRGEDWPVTGQTAIKAEQLNSPSTELLLATLCPSWAHGRYWNIDVTDYLLCVCVPSFIKFIEKKWNSIFLKYALNHLYSDCNAAWRKQNECWMFNY